MIDLNVILPIILYILGIILAIVLIIIGLRMLQIFDRIEKILDNVEEKVNTLNGLFYVIDKTTNSIDLISSKLISNITNIITKIFKKDKEEKVNE